MGITYSSPNLKKVYNALYQKPMNRKQIMQEIGIGKTTCTTVLRLLKEANMIYICEWIIDEHRKIPIYTVGNKEDAIYIRPPKKQSPKYYSKPFVEYVVPKKIEHHPLIQWCFNVHNRT